MSLQEIALTKDGFVLRSTGEPVEVRGGNAQLGRVTRNNPTDIKAGVRKEVIQRVYAGELSQGTNGYILHITTLLGEASDRRVPLYQRKVMAAFSAVLYRRK